MLVQREPGQVTTRELTELHTALAATGGPAGQLHCLYVAADSASDPERLCTYWFGDRMTQWQMKLLTQAELALAGVALYGPWPPPGDRAGPGRRHPGGRARGGHRLLAPDFAEAQVLATGLLGRPRDGRAARAEAMLTTGDLAASAHPLPRLDS